MDIADNGKPSPLSWRMASELIRTHTREVVSPTICRSPLASVCVMAYNHRPYIGQAIESILEQQTDFPLEIVVGDDHSCDGTTDIIMDYQRRYPECIRVLLSDENLGRYTGNGRLNLIRVLQSCRGRYVAFLEGDDYWIGTDKLAWGVAFLSANPQFNVAFHNLQIESPDGHYKNYYTVGEWSNPQLPMPRIFTDFKDMLHGAFIHVSTVIARYKPFDERQLDLFVKLNFGDYLLMLILSGNGKLYLQDIPRSCYRFHGKGVFSSFSTQTTWKRYVEDKRRISIFYHDVYPEVAEKNLRGILERPWARDSGVNANNRSFASNWREVIRRKVFAYTRASISRLVALLDSVEMLCSFNIEGAVLALCDDAGGEMMAIALGLIDSGNCDRTLVLLPVCRQKNAQHGYIESNARDANTMRLAVLSTGYPERCLEVRSKKAGMSPRVNESISLMVLSEPADDIPGKWLDSVFERLVSGALVIHGERLWRREPQENIYEFRRRLSL